MDLGSYGKKNGNQNEEPEEKIRSYNLSRNQRTVIHHVAMQSWQLRLYRTNKEERIVRVKK